MKPMLVTATTDLPSGPDWIYETKYDGFRCILDWQEAVPQLISRNGKSLNLMFPEILEFCSAHYEQIKPFLPLTLDGELVYLINDFQSDFSTVQIRGRMRTPASIHKHQDHFPCHYIVFDLLKMNGEDLTEVSLTKRKNRLKELFQQTNLNLSVNAGSSQRFQVIDFHTDQKELWELITLNHGEGMIAKKITSLWTTGKRSPHWLKKKNWRYVSVFLTKYDKVNGYFAGAVYRETHPVEVVHFKHGLSGEETRTLKTLFETRGTPSTGQSWTIKPSICVTIACISFDGKHLREPQFESFEFEKDPEICTWKQMELHLYPFPEKVEITHPDKPVWPAQKICKDDYLLYLDRYAHCLLPFLQNRLLTVIRYPHGVEHEGFFQKHCPDYAPNFVKTITRENIDYITCNDSQTLIWLGNQLALEFHVPFQPYSESCPSEVVFDLDPPSVDEFTLAVEAALRMKAIFDQFGLNSFVKTSGGKGLQVYLPLPNRTFSYKETRIFTAFICNFLCEQEPRLFTIERLKKNRNNRLYLDYIQHDEGKTIIAPYSPRAHKEAPIATPLEWREVKTGLDPRKFTMRDIPERIKTIGDPFHSFNEAKEQQNFAVVLDQLKELLKNK